VSHHIQSIAREGLQQARQPHWFRQGARQLLDAEDAVARLDGVVRQEGSTEQKEALRVLDAAVHVPDTSKADRLAILQEGLSVFAAGALGGAPAALSAAVLKRLRADGADSAAVSRAMRTERHAADRDRQRSAGPPPSLKVAHPIQDLPEKAIAASGGAHTLVDATAAEAMLRQEPAPAAPIEPPSAPSPSLWAKALRWLGIRAAGAATGPAGAVATHFASLPLLKIPATPAEYAVAEAYLRDAGAKIEESHGIGTGVNASSHVALNNRAQALWKPVAGEDRTRLRDQLEAGHQGRREAAAYVVDRWMRHYGKVPPTVYRKMAGRNGAMMWWLNGAQPAEDSEKASDISSKPRSKAYRRMAVLDNVLGNTDRHSGNWMVAADGVVPIDHGLCFPLRNREQGGINYDFDHQVTLDDEAVRALRALQENRADVTRELEEFLNPRAIQAMFERVDTMLKLGHTYDSWRE